MTPYPEIVIKCGNGAAWNTTVTIDGVMIPCTSVTWSAPNMSGIARAILEVPRVLIDATVQEALVKVVEVNTPDPDEHQPPAPPKASLGRAAYEAYCEAVGGKAYNGDQLPTWDQQQERNPTIAEAWNRAGRAVAALVSAPAQPISLHINGPVMDEKALAVAIEDVVLRHRGLHG